MPEKRVIVTTTINAPTEAIELFDSFESFTLVVVGDRKTPSGYKLQRGIYITPDEQEKRYPRLSQLLGWNCIQRRNIGFLIALEMGAEIMATVDDDNIPLPGWGENLLVGQTVRVHDYQYTAPAFDPIGVTNYPQLWHRGFPLQMIRERAYAECVPANQVVRVQADFWNGDPDIDAVCRMIHRPDCTFDPARFPFTSSTIAPFNSQNTFIDATLLPDYFMFPGIGRMDDIWGAYYLQAKTGVRPVFGRASVTQQRNVHDLTRDLSQEVIGYENTLTLLETIGRDPGNFFTFLPGTAVAAYLEYNEIAKRILADRRGFRG